MRTTDENPTRDAVKQGARRVAFLATAALSATLAFGVVGQVATEKAVPAGLDVALAQEAQPQVEESPYDACIRQARAESKAPLVMAPAWTPARAMAGQATQAVIVLANVTDTPIGSLRLDLLVNDQLTLGDIPATVTLPDIPARSQTVLAIPVTIAEGTSPAVVSVGVEAHLTCGDGQELVRYGEARVEVTDDPGKVCEAVATPPEPQPQTPEQPQEPAQAEPEPSAPEGNTDTPSPETAQGQESPTSADQGQDQAGGESDGDTSGETSGGENPAAETPSDQPTSEGQPAPVTPDGEGEHAGQGTGSAADDVPSSGEEPATDQPIDPADPEQVAPGQAVPEPGDDSQTGEVSTDEPTGGEAGSPESSESVTPSGTDPQGDDAVDGVSDSGSDSGNDSSDDSQGNDGTGDPVEKSQAADTEDSTNADEQTSTAPGAEGADATEHDGQAQADSTHKGGGWATSDTKLDDASAALESKGDSASSDTQDGWATETANASSQTADGGSDSSDGWDVVSDGGYDYGYDYSGDSGYGYTWSSSDPSEGTAPAKAAPSVVIRSYSYGKGASYALAGDTFPLSMTFANTSRTSAIENLTITIAPGEGLALNNGPDTLFFESIPAGTTQELALELSAKVGAEVGPTTVAASFKYEYIDGDQRQQASGESKLTVNVKRPDRFELSEPSTTEYSYLGEEVMASIPYSNKGLSSVRNVVAYVEGEGVSKEESLVEIVSVDAGKRGSIGITYCPTEVGELELAYVVEYEDANGDVVKKTRPFTLIVDEMMAEVFDPGVALADEMGGYVEEEVTTDTVELPVWSLYASGGTLLAVVVATVVAVAIARRRRAAREEEDEDWSSFGA